MLATLIDEPFDDDNWLYEVKWDGYRALAYCEGRSLRLVSRNQNDLTSGYPELQNIRSCINATNAIIDGEIVALDEQGRPSFSLMQQRTGLREGARRIRVQRADIPIAYYAFDLIYVDGYDVTRATLEQRKALLQSILSCDGLLRYSDHYVGQGTALFKAAAERGLEGIVAKHRPSSYEQKRSREWLKLKITRRQECVIGGFTDPRGARENFGSLVLGLYDEKGRLLPVGQAGSGFTEQSHAKMWQQLKSLETTKNPFFGEIDSDRRVHYVSPKLVAEIKFTEWTHEGESGTVKMRAPVFQGLRPDKKPSECRFERAARTEDELAKVESGER
jgi:bifunctional non-homologous end joining protein LigD